LPTGSDIGGIEKTEYLKYQFVTKNMGKPVYFRGIEIAHDKYEVIFSQKEYALDFLETQLLGCKPARTPMDIDPIF